jgi:hypothetical protein
MPVQVDTDREHRLVRVPRDDRQPDGAEAAERPYRQGPSSLF